MNYIDFTAGNKDYKLRLNTRNTILLEKQLGCHPLNIFDVNGNSVPSITTMVAILHASLQQYHHGITLNDAYDLFDTWLDDGHASTDFLEIILNLYKTSGIIPKDAKEDEVELKRLIGEEDNPSPKTLSELVYMTLERALDYGITEDRFWEMTLNEIHREVESKIRVKLNNQERASYDYILAQLIVRGVSKVLGDKSSYPSIEEAYPGVFDDVIAERKAKEEERKINLSALRFKQFAKSYNKKYKEVANDK